MTYMYNRN